MKKKQKSLTKKDRPASLAVTEGWAFCPACGNAVTKAERELARFDFECSRCGGPKLSSHYSLGSDSHMGRIEAWKRGERTATNWRTRGATDPINVIPPMAWPNNVDIPNRKQ